MADFPLECAGLRAAGLPRAPQDLLDLNLAAGTIACLVGPPESGKSTWLRTLAAIDPPAEGSLKIDGVDCTTLDRPTWLKLRTRVAYLGGSTALLSVLTALANVMMPAQYHARGSSEAIREEAMTWLERLGWSGPLDALPAHLSQFQRCQLLLARCLMLEPAVLVINEPMELTDIGSWPYLSALLSALARGQGLALVVLTHDLRFAQTHADRVLYTGAGGIRHYRSWQEFEEDEETLPFRQEAAVTERGE